MITMKEIGGRNSGRFKGFTRRSELGTYLKSLVVTRFRSLREIKVEQREDHIEEYSVNLGTKKVIFAEVHDDSVNPEERW